MTSKPVAIAILAMVIVPIGLGYVLAFDDVDRSGWRTKESFNLSDSILNSEAPYYLPSMSPANNSTILIDGVETTLSAPRFIDVSSTVSSIPIYNYSQTAINSSTVSPININAKELRFTPDGFAPSGGSSISPVIGGSFAFSASVSLDIFDGSFLVASDNQVTIIKNYVGNSTNWTVYDNTENIIANEITDLIIRTNSGSAADIGYRIQPGTMIISDVWLVSGLNIAISLEIIRFDGSVYNLHVPSSAFGSKSAVTVGNTVIGDVSSVSVSVYGGTATLSERGAATNNFADPSSGWRLPDAGNNMSLGTWINGTINDSVVMYVECGQLLANARMELAIVSPGQDILDHLIIRYNNCSLNSTPFDYPGNLGAGKCFQIVITSETIRITNVENWPSMYSEPVKYGAIELERSHPGAISGLRMIAQDYTNDINTAFKFRVDTTDSLAGYYPITRDASLNIPDLFGTGAFSLDVSSVGIFGDSIRIGADDYPVNDGSISVDGKTYRVLGLKIGITPNNDGYAISLNGDMISVTNDYPVIGFIGEWSLAIRGWTMEMFTSTVKEWIPGEFAFQDFSDLGVVGLIVAAFSLIGCAMIRPFSGAKILMLSVVCAIGALIFLCII